MKETIWKTIHFLCHNRQMAVLIADRLIELGYRFEGGLDSRDIREGVKYIRAWPEGYLSYSIAKSTLDDTPSQEGSLDTLFKTNGYEVGVTISGYKVEILDSNTIAVGCTIVMRQEIEKIIKLMDAKK